MKQYTVYFREPVCMSYLDQKWNPKIGKLEEFTVEKKSDMFTFYSLSPAKRLIKANIDKYKGSCITKIWANGDWENLGEIKLTASNKTFVANTRQEKANY